MDLFEFLMVLVSIIIGLGIAEILTGVAQLLRARGAGRYYWVHGVLTTAIFVALLQQWWEAWGLREAPNWSFLSLLLMLVGPVSLYLIAHLLFPGPGEGSKLQDYYYGKMRPVWVLAGVAILGSTAFRPLVFGDAVFAWYNATSFLGIAVCGWLFSSNRRRLHSILVPLILVMLVYDVIRWSPIIDG